MNKIKHSPQCNVFHFHPTGFFSTLNNKQLCFGKNLISISTIFCNIIGINVYMCISTKCNSKSSGSFWVKFQPTRVVVLEKTVSKVRDSDSGTFLDTSVCVRRRESEKRILYSIFYYNLFYNISFLHISFADSR